MIFSTLPVNIRMPSPKSANGLKILNSRYQCLLICLLFSFVFLHPHHRWVRDRFFLPRASLKMGSEVLCHPSAPALSEELLREGVSQLSACPSQHQRDLSRRAPLCGASVPQCVSSSRHRSSSSRQFLPCRDCPPPRDQPFEPLPLCTRLFQNRHPRVASGRPRSISALRTLGLCPVVQRVSIFSVRSANELLARRLPSNTTSEHCVQILRYGLHSRRLRA